MKRVTQVSVKEAQKKGNVEHEEKESRRNDKQQLSAAVDLNV